MPRAALSLYKNAVWTFLGLLLTLSGLGNLSNPEKFAPMAVLDATNSILIQIYGGMTFLGGLLVIFGSGLNKRYFERAGWQLVLPAIFMAFVIFVLTGTWNRVSVDITYLAFAFVVLSRITTLKVEIEEIRLAEDALLKLRAREVKK